jgi:hypothetical protein
MTIRILRNIQRLEDRLEREIAATSISPKDLAQRLSISYRSLCRLCKEPGFPKKYYLAPNKRDPVFRVDDCWAWLDSRQVTNDQVDELDR